MFEETKTRLSQVSQTPQAYNPDFTVVAYTQLQRSGSSTDIIRWGGRVT